MSKTFQEMKEQYPDAVLLNRVGDWYVTYCEDAVAVSAILGITLSVRGNLKTACFPAHALDTFLPKLVRASKKVCICEVKLDVEELITPNKKEQ